MKVFSRVLIAMVAAIASLFVSTGTSHAGLDNELSLVDGQDRTLTIQQWDTFLNGVFPLDRNRLTREWFHIGQAKYIVAGDGADEFEGTLELGYQIGFPWSLGVGINFSYTTPNIAARRRSSDLSFTATVGRSVPALPARSSPRTCSPVCRFALTSVTVPVSRKSPPSRWTSPVPPAVWRCPTLTAR